MISMQSQNEVFNQANNEHLKRSTPADYAFPVSNSQRYPFPASSHGRPITPMGHSNTGNGMTRYNNIAGFNSIGITSMSPATANGSSSTFNYVDEDPLFDFGTGDDNEDLFRWDNSHEPFKWNDEETPRLEYIYDHNQSDRSFMTHSNYNPVDILSRYPHSEQQVDFTQFLERLETVTGGETTEIAQAMMKLIARYFHDKITVFKNDVKVFNIPTSHFDGLHRMDSSASLDGSARVVCNFDFDSSSTLESFRDFLADADAILEDREELKMSLRSLLPPSFASSILSMPSHNMTRRLKARGKKSKALAHIRMLELEPENSGREKKMRKRGRPRKNTLTSNDSDTPEGIAPELPSSRRNSAESFMAEAMRNRRRNGSTASQNSDKNSSAVKGLESVAGSTKSFKQTKKKREGDDDWRPEKKKARVGNGKKNEGSKDDAKKINKLKTPSDKAKEEAELSAMGIDKLESHINSLQQQMKNVKHKHRKGTICPRCTTEQRLKLALRVRNKAAQEVKVVKQSAPPKVAAEAKPSASTSTGIAEEVVQDVEEKEPDSSTKEENNTESETKSETVSTTVEEI